jgi:hypothetical protein
LPIMIKKKKFGRLRSIKSVEGRSGKKVEVRIKEDGAR